ncbi:transcriptional regulator [Haloferax sp. Atlit-4N]|uniref:DUF7344 domain-containing protein n=1 Tax=unclassified Haloferax TaxID=2625095 RepID=UPI000E21F3A7|nr:MULTISPECIES: transcriptional regulator [unclassified Haloferax]RDZ39519.1 transcriptional regulator [Haloferax sp. Atlit-19N]RDZ50179.1 transcriptional regulator [Haloferax sp. Atlit-4N]
MNDAMFNALGDEHRRELLLDLLETNPQTVATQIPAEGETAQADTDRKTRIAMYHTHLPKLECQGFIRWNKETDEVIKGPQFEEIRPLLECLSDLTKQ